MVPAMSSDARFVSHAIIGYHTTKHGECQREEATIHMDGRGWVHPPDRQDRNQGACVLSCTSGGRTGGLCPPRPHLSMSGIPGLGYKKRPAHLWWTGQCQTRAVRPGSSRGVDDAVRRPVRVTCQANYRPNLDSWQTNPEPIRLGRHDRARPQRFPISIEHVPAHLRLTLRRQVYQTQDSRVRTIANNGQFPKSLSRVTNIRPSRWA